MHRLLEQSKSIKEEADEILKQSRILDILKGYGEIKIGGSYTLDVMLRPDIDLFVITEKHDWDKVLTISSEIMKSKYFREFDFVNWIDFDDKTTNPMRGYYFQPWVPTNDRLWKIDIWLITPDQDKSPALTNHFKALLDNETDDSKKILILEIKESMRQGNKYIKGVNGERIYKAVLEQGVHSVESFKKLAGLT